MRWKLVFALMAVCLTLGLCTVQTEVQAAQTYRIRINKQKNTVTVYKQKGKVLKPYKAFVCSAGKATPIGRFRIYQKLRWHTLVESTYGQYCVRFVGSILFHSVWYHRPDASTLANEEYNKLGKTASHGCIRLSVQDAKWIYDNCPMGTVVEVYRSDDPGPLGKPDAIRLPAGRGYDPTDIWSRKNPYNKKKPKITGAKNKTIAYGDSDYDSMDGIKAKNTTGYNARKRVTITVKYKKDSGSSYKKVKRVNTKKPGRYRITYQCVDEIGRKAKVTVVHRVLAKPQEPSVPDTPKQPDLPSVTPVPSIPAPSVTPVPSMVPVPSVTPVPSVAPVPSVTPVPSVVPAS